MNYILDQNLSVSYDVYRNHSLWNLQVFLLNNMFYPQVFASYFISTSLDIYLFNSYSPATEYLVSQLFSQVGV